ncbi:electron transfer flavo protein, alpha subunit [Pluteus cervinus]|uniref:Electron transfer flavo protein, alpha subunit n=1 Tax=Pluteus cervinus TaxID=181527 RepID=A0ACD3ASR1_9AGAR|nr:electron transfer flavo protein, alpha subunit [Pluteus cervinus]
MLRLPARRLTQCRLSTRSYATATSPHALVFLEHQKGVLDPGSLSALTAAQQLGGDVTGFIIGTSEEIQSISGKITEFKGLGKVFHASAPEYANPLPESISPVLETLLSNSPFTHVISSTSSFAKSLLPRVAAKLDVPAVADIIGLEHDSASNSTTFVRPIYAGNAISTVRAPGSISIKFATVRSTAFPAAQSGGGSATLEQIEPIAGSDIPTTHLQTKLAKSDRPDLSVASRVVSGGRALKNADTFAATLYPLADTLGAAVGASRAAVDAGYADNSLQVGQTGKVVAPELYLALGISGAIQHLAGMKDSKLIVAINKDPDAPIFQVADIGLVADLFEVVPQLIEKLKET